MSAVRTANLCNIQGEQMVPTGPNPLLTCHLASMSTSFLSTRSSHLTAPSCLTGMGRISRSGSSESIYSRYVRLKRVDNRICVSPSLKQFHLIVRPPSPEPGVPGIPGSKDLEIAIKRLSLRRQAEREYRAHRNAKFATKSSFLNPSAAGGMQQSFTSSFYSTVDNSSDANSSFIGLAGLPGHSKLELVKQLEGENFASPLNILSIVIYSC